MGLKNAILIAIWNPKSVTTVTMFPIQICFLLKVSGLRILFLQYNTAYISKKETVTKRNYVLNKRK